MSNKLRLGIVLVIGIIFIILFLLFKGDSSEILDDDFVVGQDIDEISDDFHSIPDVGNLIVLDETHAKLVVENTFSTVLDVNVIIVSSSLGGDCVSKEAVSVESGQSIDVLLICDGVVMDQSYAVELLTSKGLFLDSIYAVAENVVLGANGNVFYDFD